MRLDQAIGVALEFERKVRDHYYREGRVIQDPAGRHAFETLATEEQGHVDYLERCLKEWLKTGKVGEVPMRSVLPKGQQWIAEARRKLEGRPGKRVAGANEVEALKLAVEYEKNADAFYRKLVGELNEKDRALFSKFIDIEDGHLELVQAQLDSVLGTGFWFDVMEFRLEVE